MHVMKCEVRLESWGLCTESELLSIVLESQASGCQAWRLAKAAVGCERI